MAWPLQQVHGTRFCVCGIKVLATVRYQANSGCDADTSVEGVGYGGVKRK